MGRRKRRKVINSKSIMCITTILLLNFMGISYGIWGDNLNLDFSIATGYINTEFSGENIKVVGNKKGELTLNFTNERTLMIDGWCYPGFTQNIFIDIKNNGSIPINLVDIISIEEDEIIKPFRENLYLKPAESEKFKIHIDVSNENKNNDIDMLLQSINEKLESINTETNKDNDIDIDMLLQSLKENLELINLGSNEIHNFEYKLKFEQIVY